MSKPRYTWWGYIKAVIRNYPRHFEELHDIKLQSVTASYSGMPGGGGEGRTIEQLAMKTLPYDEQREYDAVAKANCETKWELANADKRLELINMVYWRGTHTLQGAAMALYIDYETAKRWQQNYIHKVARHMGVFHPENNNQKSQKNVLI